jgi:cytidylate kinase
MPIVENCSGSCSIPTPIAIDGGAATGKTTLGAALAERFDLLLFDTGVTYRGFTAVALERGVPASDAKQCTALARSLAIEVAGRLETRISIDGVDVTPRLRVHDVERSVSEYSKIAGVREVMVALQRAVAEGSPAVVVGRDIGTVVLPDAPVKFFVTASEPERAKRRALQATLWGETQDATHAGDDIAHRDKIDSSRKTAPLRPADDAVVIDTTFLGPEEVVARALEVIGCQK